MSSQTLMTKTLNLKTSEAYIFKTFAELLNNVFTRYDFHISKKDLTVKQVNVNESIMITARLHKFDKYEVTENRTVGMIANHLPKLTKSIKKKDLLKIYISHLETDKLSLKVYDASKDRNNTSDVRIQDFESFQNGQEIMPPDFGEHFPTVVIQSNDFQKMCKVMNGISKSICIEAQENAVIFMGGTSSIYGRKENFGKWRDSQPTIFKMNIPTKMLNDISKCCGLSKKLRIYAKPDLPLRISVDVGSMGEADIFISDPSRDLDCPSPPRSSGTSSKNYSGSSSK